MQNRLNSFLMYLYHVGSIRLERLGPELEFTLKRALSQNLCVYRNGVVVATPKTKRHILFL